MWSLKGFAGVVIALVNEAGAVRISTTDDAYAQFRRQHRAGNGADFEPRRHIFERRQAEVHSHNAQSNRLWTAAVNRFADFTDEELQALLNFKRSGASPPATAGSFLDLGAPRSLPEAIDWQSRTPASSAFLRDQGHCGSCWAVAAVAAIEMHVEVQTGNASRFSTEQVIDCTPNPQHCGGEGGCRGATSELAMEYVAKRGLALETGYPVDGKDDACFDSDVQPVLQLDGFTRVAANQNAQLLQAVATKGPVLVSVAGSPFFKYSSGVFDGCDADAVLNHAVILVGYGTDGDTGAKYWRIRNSWGPHWGEDGYMRILRHSQEGQHCGLDHEPEKGYACDGETEPIEVCGMCGILAHAAHPNTVTVNMA